jgi:hypothetical protein
MAGGFIQRHALKEKGLPTSPLDVGGVGFFPTPGYGNRVLRRGEGLVLITLLSKCITCEVRILGSGLPPLFPRPAAKDTPSH